MTRTDQRDAVLYWATSQTLSPVRDQVYKVLVCDKVIRQVGAQASTRADEALEVSVRDQLREILR